MRVETKLLAGALALILGSVAVAQGSGQDELRTIAEASGLQVQEVQMLLSNSPTAHTTWYATYDVSARKLRRAVEEGRVHLLASRHGATVEFAQWQRLPTRAVALVAPEQAGDARMLAFGK